MCVCVCVCVCVFYSHSGINEMQLTIRDKTLCTKCKIITFHEGQLVLDVKTLHAPRPCAQAPTEHVTRVITTHTPPPQVCEISCFITVGLLKASGCITPLTRTAKRAETAHVGRDRTGVAHMGNAHASQHPTSTRTHNRSMSMHQHRL